MTALYLQCQHPFQLGNILNCIPFGQLKKLSTEHTLSYPPFVGPQIHVAL